MNNLINEMILDTDLLKEAIFKISTVIEKKVNRPILGHCLFQSNQSELTIVGTDLEITCKVKIPLQTPIKEPFSVCIAIKGLTETVRELPGDKVHIHLDPENHFLNFESEQLKFSLVYMKDDEFPAFHYELKGTQFSIDSLLFAKMLGQYSYAMSNDETRIFLNGLFFQHINNKLRFVSIDGHRLAMGQLAFELEASESLKSGIIIPKKGVLEAKKVAESSVSPEINIWLDEGLIILCTENTQLSIRLINRDYPNYQAVIPATTNYNIQIKKSELAQCVKRVKIFSNEQTQGIKLHLRDKTLEISSSNSSLGKAQEKITCDYEGNEIEFGLNAKYLQDTLSNIEGEQLSIHFNNPQGPILFQSPQDTKGFGIIMPLKV
ncbi:MAG: DNA polymerase III subunit beta [Bacteriovoracaceae bacterium]|nr:DNA polymerase III subunit beta [Bacteriovoracaceae bacterium]